MKAAFGGVNLLGSCLGKNHRVSSIRMSKFIHVINWLTKEWQFVKLFNRLFDENDVLESRSWPV